MAYDNPSFPAYIRTNSFSNMPNYPFIYHWHEDLEFFLVLSGSVTYIIDGKTVVLKENDGIFVNSRHMHNGIPVKDSDCKFICILLHPSLLTANSYFAQEFVEPFIRCPEYPYLVLNHTTL